MCTLALSGSSRQSLGTTALSCDTAPATGDTKSVPLKHRMRTGKSSPHQKKTGHADIHAVGAPEAWRTQLCPQVSSSQGWILPLPSKVKTYQLLPCVSVVPSAEGSDQLAEARFQCRELDTRTHAHTHSHIYRLICSPAHLQKAILSNSKLCESASCVNRHVGI